MEKEQIRKLAAELNLSVPGNELCTNMDIKTEYVGTRMYNTPILGFGAAEDPLFEE